MIGRTIECCQGFSRHLVLLLVFILYCQLQQWLGGELTAMWYKLHYRVIC